MQTNFSLAQLADPDIAEADGILRKCVHCGFCTATCPTYVLLGDELDSPRGRIYLIKDMLEDGRPASKKVVTHIDRCLSCLACVTTCPSGVDYMHLVDHARGYIEKTYRRPWLDRRLRDVFARVLPSPRLFRFALIGALVLKPFARLLPGRLGAMAGLAPGRIPGASPVDTPQVFPAAGARRKRVALLSGCAQQVLAPEINEATVRVLTRLGCEVVVAQGIGCCGALVHHMGRTEAAHAAAKANIAAWRAEIDGAGLDAIVINASGCGTTVKDYGHMLRGDAAWAERAAAVSALAKDVSEVLAGLDIAPRASDAPRPVVAYHDACSLRHGQRVTAEPRQVLRAAGFDLREVAEGHLCCGSAGTYNLMQPALAAGLRERKVANLRATGASVVAAGNIGCITQLAGAARMPVVHTVELVDWATGGPRPRALGPEELIS